MPNFSKQKPHKIIWLQWHGEDNDRGPADGVEVTWSKNKIYDNDLCYVLDTKERWTKKELDRAKKKAEEFGKFLEHKSPLQPNDKPPIN